jgi:ribosome-binding factor A
MAHTTSAPSQRQLRVGEQLRHVIVETLREGHFHDETLLRDAHFVTVTEVRVSPDMKYATAYVLRLGGGKMEDLLESLNLNAHIFQQDFGRQIRTRNTPRLRFVMDDSFDEANRIEEILHNLPKPAEQD